jgi:hypothetical protein
MRLLALSAAVVAALLTGPAWAGSVTVKIGPTGQERTALNWTTIPDAAFVNRILPALRDHFGQSCVDTPPDPETRTPGTHVCTDLTINQALDKLGEKFKSEHTELVRVYEKQEAAKAAQGNVTGLPQ